MGRGSTTLRGWLLGLCLGCRAESSPPAAESVTLGVESWGRLIAMGDVHGDLDAAIDALMAVGVVDEEGRWVGGETGPGIGRPEVGLDDIETLPAHQACETENQAWVCSESLGLVVNGNSERRDLRDTLRT